MEAHPPAVTRSQIGEGLRRLGLRAGGIVMVHTRMSALGWVVGGSGTVVQALLDVLGPEGTLAAYAGWEDHVYRPEERPEAWRDAFLAEPPVFDPATGEAVSEHGRIPERIRTWPGARRSVHPDASVVAVGARAAWLTADHPRDDSYGAGSPLARLVEAGGQVLMLGAPLDTLTLLHHAEAMARPPGKRRVRYRIPVLEDGTVREWAITDIDTSGSVYPEGLLGVSGEDVFAVIAREALDAGIGVRGQVAGAESRTFDAARLTAFAVAWLEARLTAS